MRTRHEQAATHGGRFRSRYESQAAAQRLRRHRAQNQRRGPVEQQDACATTTASNSLTFISKVSFSGNRARPTFRADLTQSRGGTKSLRPLRWLLRRRFYNRCKNDRLHRDKIIDLAPVYPPG